jgi:hypothetical protein
MLVIVLLGAFGVFSYAISISSSASRKLLCKEEEIKS